MKLLWKSIIVVALTHFVAFGAHADKPEDIKPMLSKKFSNFIKNGNGDVCGFLNEIALDLNVDKCNPACTNTVQGVQACVEKMEQEAKEKYGPIFTEILSVECPSRCTATSCSTEYTKLGCLLCCATGYLDDKNACCQLSTQNVPSSERKK